MLELAEMSLLAEMQDATELLFSFILLSML